MPNSDHTTKGPHDLGGEPGGPVDRAEHVLNFWEWRIDAMVRLLLEKGVIVDFAELRRGVEDLGPTVYDDLTYYERWAASVATLVTEKGVISREELEARITALQARAENRA